MLLVTTGKKKVQVTGAAPNVDRRQYKLPGNQGEAPAFHPKSHPSPGVIYDVVSNTRKLFAVTLEAIVPSSLQAAGRGSLAHGREDRALPSLPRIPPPHHSCSLRGGTYVSSSHSQLPLNPLKCGEYPGRSFYKAGRGTCPIFVTSTQAHRLLPAEGQVGSIGRRRTPALGDIYPSLSNTLRMGGRPPPPTPGSSPGLRMEGPALASCW